MKYEISCGAVVFSCQNMKLQYVIIKSLKGKYGFPKGHMEEGENESQTALREIYEETGLHVQLISGFRMVIEYPLFQRPAVKKKVVYFAAEYENQTIHYQRDELSGAYLMTYNEAMDIIQFENTRKVLHEADCFIRQTVMPHE